MTVDSTNSSTRYISSRNMLSAINLAKKYNRKVIEHVVYWKEVDTLGIICPPFALYVKRVEIPELKGIPADDMSGITVSPTGTTIILEAHDIYIEAAVLVS